MRKIKTNLLSLKFIVLLGLAFLVFACQKDDILTQQENNFAQPKFEIKTLNRNAIKENQKISKKISNLNIKNKAIKGQSDNQRVINNTDFGFSIDTDYVKYLEDAETGYHSYNFPLTRDSLQVDNVENLLLSLNEDGEYDAFIVTYSFTKQEYLNMDTNTLTSRITKYVPINFDTSVFNSNELSKMVAEYSCVELWSYEYGWSEGHGYLHGAGCNSSCGDWVLSSSECGWIAYDDGSNNDGPSGGGDVSNGDVTSGGGNSSNPTGGSDSNYDPTDSNIHGNGSNGSLSSVPTVPEDVEEEEEDEEDCTSSVPDNVISELDNVFGAGNYEIDCSSNNDLPSFNSINDFNDFINSFENNSFALSNSSNEISLLGTIRRDDIPMIFSNFPDVSFITTIKAFIPEDNNQLECLDIINATTTIEGDTSLLTWTQTDHTNPNNSNGVLVVKDEQNNKVEVRIRGEMKFGGKIPAINIGIQSTKVTEIKIEYDYSTSEINYNNCYWFYIN